MHRIKQTLPIFILLAFSFCRTSSYVKGHKRSKVDSARRQGMQCFAQHNQLLNKDGFNGETNTVEHGERIFPTSSCGRINKDSGRHRRAASHLLDPPEVRRRPEVRRQRRHSDDAGSDSAAYFDGSSEILQFKNLGRNSTADDLYFPRRHFTAALWVKPEGGQMDPVVIVGLFDTCTSTWDWSMGIKTLGDDGERSPSFFLHFRSARSRKTTLLVSHNHVLPARWVHLAAVYDGRRVMLFIDGGRVGVEGGQRGPIFVSSISPCKRLLLGGSPEKGHHFRGSVADFVVIDDKLDHREVLDLMKLGVLKQRRQNSYFLEEFSSLADFTLFSKKTGKEPTINQAAFQRNHHDVMLLPPPCGMTTCDDPEVILSYVNDWHLRIPKTIKYRVINIADDNGSNPTVTPEQIKRQDKAMNEAFGLHNITFKMNEYRVLNTSLRGKVILDSCEPEMIGDSVCHCQCKHPTTGNDGGDCDVIMTSSSAGCDSRRIGNGQCEDECNYNHYAWDGGDCCLSASSRSCRDPVSPHRGYLSLNEYKKLLSLPADSDLNVYFANWTDPDVLGIATFPWGRHVHTIMGGIVMKPDVYGVAGKTDNMIHELGHILGLLHVHHGVSEVGCDDPCRETEPSLELGDLCADTNPTPTNGQCADPGGDGHGCGTGPYQHTPFRNFMSYSDDECMNHFTGQQAARMHCYIDLAYQRWQLIPKPSPVPLPPRVVESSESDVSIRWTPPIGSGRTAIDQICSDCRVDRSLVQFGATATYNGKDGIDEAWSALQVTGPPDAKPCTPSPLAWKPSMLNPSCIGTCREEHILEVSFRVPVVPRRLTIWVIYNASRAISDVELVFKDRVSRSLGPITAQCDVPYTTQLTTEKLLRKVRIHSHGPFVAIDAVMLESGSDHSGCAVCPTIQYAITRQPPFPEGRITTEDLLYTDREVAANEKYTYFVQTILGSKVSERSPPLYYVHGQHYCGDGKGDEEEEECDDGNVLNGDGCDILCKVEELFRCSGSPSRCVHHVGDGVCEPGEETSVLADCGFVTPGGVVDQWVKEARATPAYQTPQCPASVIVGQPLYKTVETCRVATFSEHPIWFPCGYMYAFQANDFWIEAFFPRAVVATNIRVYSHIREVTMESSMLLMMLGASRNNNLSMSASLIDVHNRTHPTAGKHEQTTFSCQTQPMTFNVYHDLSTGFFLSKGVRIVYHSPNIGISAIVLRSSEHMMKHLGVRTCSQEQLYNPHTGECVEYVCDKPECVEFAIKYGNTTCTGVSEGDTCQVQCNPGYRLVEGYREAICSRGRWIGATVCKPVDCGHPDVLHARLDCPDGYTFGKKCKFECRKPAIKIGTGSAIVCEDDAMWSLPEALCQMSCVAPPVVKNSTLTTPACRRRDRLRVGTQCRYKCHKGFHVEGEHSKRRVMRYSCTDRGQWVGPVCVRVQCPLIDPLLHGLYSCTQYNNAASVCTLKCPGPNRVTSSIRCQQDGEWDSDFTPCKFEPGECPQIPPAHNLTIDCLNGYGIGARCQLSCLDYHQEPVLPSSGHGARRQTGWTVRDRVVRQITCTAQQQWFPHTASVACIDKCDEEMLGDGICDAINNRQSCEWDGGDCCASTTLGGMVQQRPGDLCISGCECEDPRAVESSQTDSDSSPSSGF